MYEIYILGTNIYNFKGQQSINTNYRYVKNLNPSNCIYYPLFSKQ